MGHPSRLQLRERAASVTSCNVSRNVYFFLNHSLKARLPMWMVESWRGRLLQLLIGLERGQTGKSHKQSGRPTVHSCAVSWASPKRRLAVASGLWGLSLAAQTSPDHPALYVFGITLGIVSCTHVTDTIPVCSRGEFHSEAAWANTPTPGNPPSPPSLLWGGNSPAWSWHLQK